MEFLRECFWIDVYRSKSSSVARVRLSLAKKLRFIKHHHRRRRRRHLPVKRQHFVVDVGFLLFFSCFIRNKNELSDDDDDYH